MASQSSSYDTSQSSNSSSNQGTSSSSSFIPNYPQSAFLQSIAQHASDYADKAYSRYDSTFQPLENSLISDAQKFQDPNYLKTVGGEASAGAAQAGEAQRTNSLRDLQAFGIDPSSGRYDELDKSERGRLAATQTGASQMAMRATQQAGRDMRGQAIGIGQKNLDRASQNLQTAESMKYPPLGNASQSQNSGGSSGQSSGQKSSQTSQQDPNQGGGGGGAPQGGGNNPPPPSSAGISTTALPEYPPSDPGYPPSDPGMQGDPNWGGMDYGGGNAAGPSNWQDPANNSGNAYDSGGSGDGGSSSDSGGDSYAAGGGEIDGQQGGAIPTGDSPSGGQQVDDVNIHANAGEFMIPKDVAAWKGQEFFQKLIETSRKARVTAPAHGTSNPAQAQQQGQAENRAMGQ